MIVEDSTEIDIRRDFVQNLQDTLFNYKITALPGYFLTTDDDFKVLRVSVDAEQKKRGGYPMTIS